MTYRRDLALRFLREELYYQKGAMLAHWLERGSLADRAKTIATLQAISRATRSASRFPSSSAHNMERCAIRRSR